MNKVTVTLGTVLLGTAILVGLGTGVFTESEQDDGKGLIQKLKVAAAIAVDEGGVPDIGPPKAMRASTSPERDAKAREELGYSLGMQAYIYGIPSLRLEEFRFGFHRLGLMASAVGRGHQIEGFGDGVVFNELLHARILPTPEVKLGLTANVDTTYTSAYYNLQAGPLVFTVPEINNRYYSVQIVDANLSNVAYIGTRATDAVAGDYLLIGPDWQGEFPDELIPVHLPTNEGFLAIRILVDGQDDLPQVVKLQDQFALQALVTAGEGGGNPEPLAVPKPNRDGELSEYRRIVEIAQRNPPRDPQTLAMWQSFKYIGMNLDKPFDAASIDPAIKKGMQRALESTADVIAWKVKYRGYKSESMWNVDLLGGSYQQDYLARAEGAIQGLIVHDADEGMYFHTYHDGKGELLDGGQRYTLDFPAGHLPPVQAFWSMTAYTDDYNLVENELQRYAIGDRTDGLKYNADGSLTIYVQSTRPEAGARNWLPTPETGLFRLNLRMYMPEPVMKDKEKLEAFLPPLIKQS